MTRSCEGQTSQTLATTTNLLLTLTPLAVAVDVDYLDAAPATLTRHRSTKRVMFKSRARTSAALALQDLLSNLGVAVRTVVMRKPPATVNS